jgi:UDP-3-O-[3-hydroxymyristoyl] glucosamine N-acyltransferase
MEFSVNQIAQLIGGEVKGEGERKVRKLGKIQEAEEGSITFLANPKYEPFIYTTGASAAIVGRDMIFKEGVKPSLILVDDPYLSFTLLLEEYQKIISLSKSGVENPSYLGDNSYTGENIYRGAFSYIGNNVNIGNNVKIYPHVFIGDNVSIGDNCIFYSGSKIYANTEIGNNCVIHSGAVLGSDGFGFAPTADGSYKTIPQLGNVILRNNVDVGANTVIDRATLGSTIINNGTKLDNLIQIAHNVVIGENTVIAAQAGISGSTKIGDNCMIGGQAGITGHLEIANRTSIAGNTGIMSSIKEEGKVLLGYIAMEKGDFLRSYAIFRKLPDLNTTLKELEKKTLNLPTH